jgi:flagellar basal body-associated protein FliL
MKSKSEAGVAHVVLLVLVLVVVAAVVLVGVRVMQNQNTGENSTTSSAPVATTGAPDKINNASDLNAAKAALSQNNVDGDLNPSSLDADLNAVL